VALSGSNIVAVAAIGSTVIVAVCGWVFQWKSEGRRFERERRAADVEDLRVVLDAGAMMLKKFDDSRQALEDFAFEIETMRAGHKTVSPALRKRYAVAEAHNEALEIEARALSTRLRLRLDNRRARVNYEIAVGRIAMDSGRVRTRQFMRYDEDVQTRFAMERNGAISDYFKGAIAVIDSPLTKRTGHRTSPWPRRIRSRLAWWFRWPRDDIDSYIERNDIKLTDPDEG
jgi:hypothetical protein